MHFTSILMIALIGLTRVETAEDTFKPPNIVILMADDMGIDDVSFHGNKQFITPNIDALAYHGMILQHLYAPPMCTPSRAAFMTGKYPIHTGTQHFVISNEQPWGLPQNITTIAEVFQEAGYATHLVGKWHLGLASKGYLPLRRGFDTHYGYLGGYIDYYKRTALMPVPNTSIGYDFRRNFELDFDKAGTYMTDLLTTEAESVIEAHNIEKPLFLVVNHLAPHTGNDIDPLQAPKEEINKFNYIEDVKRRVYAAMVSKLDASIGNITKALDKKQILNNTILIFYSDNGAPSVGMFSNTGSNYPMRGQKNSPWEGAVRVAGAIWSPLLNNRNTVFKQKIYIGDWLPTLASAAKIPLSQDLNIDGLDLWNELSSGNAEPFERDIVHMIDDISNVVSITSGGFKYINGTTLNGTYDSVLTSRHSEQDPRDIMYSNSILSSTSSKVLQKYDKIPLTEARVNLLRTLGEIKCGNLADKVKCNPLVEECLFKINQDPCEENNLAKLDEYECILNDMRLAVADYRSGAREPANLPGLPDGDPSLHHCTWTWFLDEPPSKDVSCCTNDIIHYLNS